MLHKRATLFSSVAVVSWPPTIGERLPRAESAWCTQAKLTDWVLGARGHADEWRRVFRVGGEDAEFIWDSIAEAVPRYRVTEVRGKGSAVSYGVLIELQINDRIAPVLTAWHYQDAKASPRLVTAYPRPYTRRNGNHG